MFVPFLELTTAQAHRARRITGFRKSSPQELDQMFRFDVSGEYEAPVRVFYPDGSEVYPMYTEIGIIEPGSICRRDSVKGGQWTLVKIIAVDWYANYNAKIHYETYNPENGVCGKPYTTEARYESLHGGLGWVAGLTIAQF